MSKANEWYEKNSERHLKRCSEYYQHNKERIKAYSRQRYQEKKEQLRAQIKNWQAANPEKTTELKRKSKHKRLQESELRRKLRYFYRDMRRSHVKRATPKWADRQAIKDFYLNRPNGMTIDHIVPLRGKNVCGLHVRSNLQYLTGVENSKKGNAFG